MSEHQSHPTHTAWGHVCSASRTWDRQRHTPLIHPMAASHPKNIAWGMFGSIFLPPRRYSRLLAGRSRTHPSILVPCTSGRDGEQNKAREGEVLGRRDVCAVSCLSFPSICDCLRTAVSVMHGQKRESEAQGGVWRNARGKDGLSLAAHSPSPTSLRSPSPEWLFEDAHVGNGDHKVTGTGK